MYEPILGGSREFHLESSPLTWTDLPGWGRMAIVSEATAFTPQKIIIIGGGPGGYESALVAANLGADVTIIEEKGMGGSAVLTDVVPSKTLIASADTMNRFSEAPALGIRTRAGDELVELEVHIDKGMKGGHKRGYVQLLHCAQNSASADQSRRNMLHRNGYLRGKRAAGCRYASRLHCRRTDSVRWNRLWTVKNTLTDVFRTTGVRLKWRAGEGFAPPRR